jgi:site-specific DNA-methyltransferase (adenine-specific)
MRVGPHTLLQGDCLKILPELDPGSVDVVVTSPPYNLDLDYGAYEDKRSEADYLGWMVEVQAVFEPQS